MAQVLGGVQHPLPPPITISQYEEGLARNVESLRDISLLGVAMETATVSKTKPCLLPLGKSGLSIMLIQSDAYQKPGIFNVFVRLLLHQQIGWKEPHCDILSRPS
jgi:hypothetical protein